MGFFATVGSLLAKAAPTLIGGALGSGTPSPEEVDYDELAKRQLKTQGLVDERLGRSLLPTLEVC